MMTPTTKNDWPLASVVPRLRNCHLEAGFRLLREAGLSKVQGAFFHVSSVAPSFPRLGTVSC